MTASQGHFTARRRAHPKHSQPRRAPFRHRIESERRTADLIFSKGCPGSAPAHEMKKPQIFPRSLLTPVNCYRCLDRTRFPVTCPPSFTRRRLSLFLFCCLGGGIIAAISDVAWREGPRPSGTGTLSRQYRLQPAATASSPLPGAPRRRPTTSPWCDQSATWPPCAGRHSRPR